MKRDAARDAAASASSPAEARRYEKVAERYNRKALMNEENPYIRSIADTAGNASGLVHPQTKKPMTYDSGFGWKEQLPAYLSEQVPAFKGDVLGKLPKELEPPSHFRLGLAKIKDTENGNVSEKDRKRYERIKQRLLDNISKATVLVQQKRRERGRSGPTSEIARIEQYVREMSVILGAIPY